MGSHLSLALAFSNPVVRAGEAMLLPLHADARPQPIILSIALLLSNETWMDLQTLVVPHNAEALSPWTCQTEMHAGRRRGAGCDAKQEALESPLNHSSELHQVCSISAATLQVLPRTIPAVQGSPHRHRRQ